MSFVNLKNVEMEDMVPDVPTSVDNVKMEQSVLRQLGNAYLDVRKGGRDQSVTQVGFMI